MSRFRSGPGVVRSPELAHVRRTMECVEGKYIERMVVTCAVCATGFTFPYWPPSRFSRNLSQRGWADADNPRRATCPACIARGKAAKVPEKKKEADMPAQKPQTPFGLDAKLPVDTLPRSPSRDDRRRIRDYLDVHYDDENSRYQAKGSDDAAAAALAVPRVWVGEIREQFYGPDTNAEKQVAPVKVADLIAKLKAAEDKAIAVLSECEALRGAAAEYLKTIGAA